MLRGDPIDTFKILNGLEGVESFKLRAATTIWQLYFSHRVIDDWNDLPQKMVSLRQLTCSRTGSIDIGKKVAIKVSKLHKASIKKVRSLKIYTVLAICEPAG